MVLFIQVINPLVQLSTNMMSVYTRYTIRILNVSSASHVTKANFKGTHRIYCQLLCDYGGLEQFFLLALRDFQMLPSTAQITDDEFEPSIQFWVPD